MYISIDEVLRILIEGDGHDEFTVGYNFAVNEHREKIKAISAADVRENCHGVWHECYTDAYHYSGICSVCGKVSIKSLTEDLYDFCPKCGAKMDGKFYF